MARKVNNKPFAEALDDLLAEREWSRRELVRRMQEEADRGGGASISEMESGKRRLTIEAMEAVASALRISPDHFLEYRLERYREALDWYPPTLQAESPRRALALAMQAAKRPPNFKAGETPRPRADPLSELHEAVGRVEGLLTDLQAAIAQQAATDADRQRRQERRKRPQEPASKG